MKNLRLIPTGLHGALDYIAGIVLIASPWIFMFAEGGGAPVSVPIITGIAIIVYSALTRYEWGVAGIIPMGYHLILDFLAGAFLALSPWIFLFADQDASHWAPHVIAGLVILALAFLTRINITGSE